MMNALVAAMFRGMDGDAKLAGSDMAAHMPTLYLLARQWSFGPVVEIGVGRGWSTVSLLAGTLDGGGRLVSYDTAPSAKESAIAAMGIPAADPRLAPWEFRARNSVDGAGDFADGSVALWFLDTTHTYADTRAELAAWLPKIHPAGLMCGHDYLLHQHPAWSTLSGVHHAVDEFAAAHRGRFRLQVLPHDWGLWILWPKAAEKA
jgi:predicted O-methyltransferase YrrM